jgi:hypothetical protein
MRQRRPGERDLSRGFAFGKEKNMAAGCPMMRKMETDHPCFGGDHAKAGRMHLPVAPGCNIK